MQTAHELFLHELGDILNAEHNLVDALEEQAEAVTNEQLKTAITGHRAQTEKQVERLEQVFEDLGEEAEEAECKGVKGLVEEWKTFKEEEDPSDDILNVVTINAAAKVESYEINVYESLIQMARDMEHSKAVKLLQQNLKEEQQTLKKMQGFARKNKLPFGLKGKNQPPVVAAKRHSCYFRCKILPDDFFVRLFFCYFNVAVTERRPQLALRHPQNCRGTRLLSEWHPSIGREEGARCARPDPPIFPRRTLYPRHPRIR